MKQNSKVLTLIICTYDRNDILKLCLDALSHQSADRDNYDVLVVNNCVTDIARQELRKVILEYPEVKSIEEAKTGLSNARNRGTQEAKTKWIGYIDDDCLVQEGFVQKVLDIIKETQFDGFGGHIQSWWQDPRPRWMSSSYGSKPILSKLPIQLISDSLWGGNMFFRRSVVEELGGFDNNKGMKGAKVGYAEENLLQIKMRKNGYSIGYYPNLVVDHLIGKQKLNLSWHLEAAFAEGRDGREVFPEQYTFSHILKEFISIPLVKLRSLRSLLFQKGYYWENWILDVFKPICRIAGKVLS